MQVTRLVVEDAGAAASVIGSRLRPSQPRQNSVPVIATKRTEIPYLPKFQASLRHRLASASTTNRISSCTAEL